MAQPRPKPSVKITIIGSRGYPYVYSGYETFVTEVAPRLVERGHEVTVHCFKELFDDMPPMFRGVRLTYIGGSRRKSLAQISHSWGSVRHLLGTRQDRPDVALFVNAANGLFGPLLRAGGICTAINVDGLEWERPKWHGLGSKVYYLAAKMAVRWFDLIITDAFAMAAVYLREFNATSTVIEYGASLWKTKDQSLLDHLGVKAGDYFLIVGRLIPDNNVGLMVEGFVRSSTDKKLVVVGDVPYQDAYADAVKSIRDPRVVFTGYVKDQELLRELYCGAFAYMHGHEHGGTNPALLKALGAGCSILALDTAFSREVLLGERHGMYFPKDRDGVAGAVMRMELEHEEVARQRAIARDRISAYYNWDRITDAYESAFSSLIARA